MKWRKLIYRKPNDHPIKSAIQSIQVIPKFLAEDNHPFALLHQLYILLKKYSSWQYFPCYLLNPSLTIIISIFACILEQELDLYCVPYCSLALYAGMTMKSIVWLWTFSTFPPTFYRNSPISCRTVLHKIFQYYALFPIWFQTTSYHG